MNYTRLFIYLFCIYCVILWGAAQLPVVFKHQLDWHLSGMLYADAALSRGLDQKACMASFQLCDFMILEFWSDLL